MLTNLFEIVGPSPLLEDAHRLSCNVFRANGVAQVKYLKAIWALGEAISQGTLSVNLHVANREASKVGRPSTLSGDHFTLRATIVLNRSYGGSSRALLLLRSPGAHRLGRPQQPGPAASGRLIMISSIAIQCAKSRA